jgi:hypothetical protein
MRNFCSPVVTEISYCSENGVSQTPALEHNHTHVNFLSVTKQYEIDMISMSAT